MKLSIIYITCRKEPMFNWFVQSLLLQKRDNDTPIEVIVVNGGNSPEFTLPEGISISKDSPICYVNPFPSAVQGPYRKTSQDWFSASLARNTGICHSTGDYIVFVDDLSVLLDGWLNAVIQAANENYCVLGTYEKRNHMVVENGVLISSTQESHDTRQMIYERTPANGGWLYGCSFGLPIEYALKINGFDHICDCIGTEDTQMGARLQRTGLPIYLDRRMKTIESAELHFGEGNYFRRESFPCSKQRYYDMLHKYGVQQRPERDYNLYDAPWFINDLLKYHPNKIESFANTYNLRTLRDKIMKGGEITEHDMNLNSRFWWTRQEWNEL